MFTHDWIRMLAKELKEKMDSQKFDVEPVPANQPLDETVAVRLAQLRNKDKV